MLASIQFLRKFSTRLCDSARSLMCCLSCGATITASERAESHSRVLNFLRNWIDANILHASEETRDDASSLQHWFLTDAVAAGLPLEEVNEEWDKAEIEIRKAFNKRRAGS